MDLLKKAIERMPKYELVLAPTPLHRLKNMEKEYDYSNIYIKRDDLTGLGPGGNKLRSLEFIIGEAISMDCDTVIAGGPEQSNFCTLTAVACAKAGIKCILVHNGEKPKSLEGNIVLNELLGVESHFIGKVDSSVRGKYEEELAERLENEGKKPYIAKKGATTGIGALGYVNAIIELVNQCKTDNIKLDSIYAPGGNGGVATGLIYGNALAGFPFKINIISVEYDKAELIKNIEETILEVEELLGLKFEHSVEDASNIIDDYRGLGWGENTTESSNEVLAFPRSEGIFIENVYNSKVLVGMKDQILKGKAEGNICYLHTGGFGSLFSQYK